MFYPLNKILACACAVAVTGCSSKIEPVGQLGPNKLQVYAIKNNDFFSASKMLVVLDKKGNVSAYTGGTVAGGGAIGMQAVDTVVSAGAIVVGAQAIQHGLENASIKGIPHSLNVKTNSSIDISGSIKNAS